MILVRGGAGHVGVPSSPGCVTRPRRDRNGPDVQQAGACHLEFRKSCEGSRGDNVGSGSRSEVHCVLLVALRQLPAVMHADAPSSTTGAGGDAR